LAPFGQAVSEEKIFVNISQSEKRIALGSHVCSYENLQKGELLSLNITFCINIENS
jgi:hypothetical protein